MAKKSPSQVQQQIKRLRDLLKRKDWTRGQRVKLMTALELRKKELQMRREEQAANDR